MGFHLARVPSFYRIRPSSLVFFLPWVHPFTNVISKYCVSIVSTDIFGLMFLNSLSEGTNFLSTPKLVPNDDVDYIHRRISLCLEYLAFIDHSILYLEGLPLLVHISLSPQLCIVLLQV